MWILSEYLETINNQDKKINSNILDSYESFDYPNKYCFRIDLELLLETVYDEITLVNAPQKTRLNQKEFRLELIKLYQSKCVISSNSNPDELEAAHIVEIACGGDYDISNGLLLEANIHKTYDKYQWTINPNTLEIEVKDGYLGSITKYIGKKINLELNPVLYSNLKYRYEKFME